jgi:hypothetical protein
MGALLFVLAGVGLVIGSVLAKDSKWVVTESVLLNLGLAALAIVLVDVLWRAAGGHPLDSRIEKLDVHLAELSASIDVIDQARSVGLHTIFQRQGDFGTQADWERLIQSARRSVDVAGRTAYGWVKSGSIVDTIVEKIKRDRVSFRWLVMSRRNKYLPLLMEEGIVITAMLESKLEATERFLLSIRARLTDDEARLFQVRVFESVPLYCGMIRADDRWHITQYLASRSSDDSPLTCLAGSDGSWVTAYGQEFESIWNRSGDLFDAVTTSA